MGNEQGRPGEPTPAGIQSMDESLQKKFSKGIQYNMKIVIRGDRNTGKSCLFRRMEGKPFQEAYIPTNEIEVTSILWSYKVTNDTVKVEIWDIVDKGRSQRKSGRGGATLKMSNDPDEHDENGDKVLDAGFLDVYKGAHGVVFLYDITKQWTWQYIERELPKVPFSLPVMIIGNFRDMGDHRVVSREVCSYYIEHMDRPEGAADVRYAEASMKNGFGLMHLHKFLSVPFLHLQQETLLQQLQVNREQMLAAREELNTAHLTEDQSYDLFERKLERMAEEIGRRRTKSIEQEVPGAGDESPTTPKRREVIESEKRVVGEDSPDLARHVQQPRHPPPPSSSAATTERDERKGSFKSKLTSKLSGFLSRAKEEPVKEESPDLVLAAPPSRPRAKPTSKVEDFVPEGDVDGFFEDEEEEEDEDEEEEDSDDDDTHIGKPQIAMDEDLSSPEEEEAPPPAPPTSAATKPSPQVSRPPVTLKSAKDVELTESESEEDAPEVMADEDLEEEHRPAVSVGSWKTKDVLSGELFDVDPTVEKKKKKSSKSSGLMLEFNLPPPSQTEAKASAAEESRKESPLGTPEMTEKRKDAKSKKKKSKKSRHDKEEAETTQGSGQSGGGSAQAPPISSDDPFGPIAALDAWLNSDSTDFVGGDVLQPSQVEAKKQEDKPKSAVVEVGKEEEGEEGEGSPETHRKKSKKHKHHKKHHRGDRDEEEEGRTSKKKHRHHRSSRHGASSRPSAETVGEYDEI